MASKGNNSPPPERSRVRFMLVDFDGSSADLQQLAHTFASAVKMPQPIIMTAPPALPGVATPPTSTIANPPQQNGHTPLFDGIHPTEPDGAAPEVIIPPASKSQGAAKRKLKTPSIISDLEFNDGPNKVDPIV